MSTKPILFTDRPVLYKPGESITRVDNRGVPMIVQRLHYDPVGRVYRAVYFDGSACLFDLPGVGADTSPGPHWGIAEHQAEARYYRNRLWLHGLALDGALPI